MKAYRSLSSFRDGAEFRPWLLRIVVNESRNLHRGQSRRSDRELRVVREDARLVTGSDPAEVAVREERREALLGAIRALRRNCARSSPADTCSSSPRPRPPSRSTSRTEP